MKIASLYKSALGYYYRKFYTEVKDLSYREHIEHLLNFGLGWANFYQVAFRNLGYEFIEIVADDGLLQKKWAIEHLGSDDYNLLEIIFEQIKFYKPEVIWFQDSITFPKEFIVRVKQLPFVKLIFGNICSPYTSTHLEVFREFAFVTVCTPSFVSDLESKGIRTLLLYHAFCKDMLRRIKYEELTKENRVVFIGSISSQKGFHRFRKQILTELAKADIAIDIYANLYDRNIAEVVKKQIVYILSKALKISGLHRLFLNTTFYRKAETLNAFPTFNFLHKKLLRKLKPAVYGIDMYKELASSLIGLNIQADIAKNYAVNMRIFETTGVGTLLITNDSLNLKDIFEPEKEVITFSSVSELIEKLKWYLSHPLEAQKIALNAQKRTLTHHTYENRAKVLINYLNTFL